MNLVELPAEQKRRLDEVAVVLRSCRDVYMEVWKEGLNTPRPGSQAAFDFALVEECPAGVWPSELTAIPRNLATKLLRQQADHCVAVAVLIENTEIFDPLLSVVRAGFEYTTRAMWVLDPTASPRERCVRAALTELISKTMARQAASDLPDSPDLQQARAVAKTQWREQVRRLEELFHDVNRDDGDPLKWTIEGVGYASWTEAAETWSKIENTGVSGRAIYNQLAVLAHPQGYSATVGLRPDPADASGTIRLVDLIRVEKAARITVQSFYSALTMLTSYHGLRSKIVSRWESEIQAVFPTFFNADGDAADLEENT